MGYAAPRAIVSGHERAGRGTLAPLILEFRPAPHTADSLREMDAHDESARVSRDGVRGSHGERYPWAYYLALLAAIMLLTVDLIGDGAQWTNLGAMLFVLVAVMVRPGGLRGT